jgi:hypothetical protein
MGRFSTCPRINTPQRGLVIIKLIPFLKNKKYLKETIYDILKEYLIHITKKTKKFKNV